MNGNFLMNLEEDNQNSVFPKKAGPAFFAKVYGGYVAFGNMPKFTGIWKARGKAQN